MNASEKWDALQAIREIEKRIFGIEKKIETPSVVVVSLSWKGEQPGGEPISVSESEAYLVHLRLRCADLGAEANSLRDRAEKAEAEVVRLRRVLAAIEDRAVNCEHGRCWAYRFSHTENNPGCRENHPQWTQELEKAMAEIRK